MHVKSGKFRIPLHELPEVDRMALMEEVRSWQVRIAFLGDSSNRQATTNPEAYASARILQNLVYFEEIVDIIDYGRLRSGLTSQINGYQK
ncbi:MAG: hypothetical protein WB679_00760, partial [Terracidiphilus sp.]